MMASTASASTVKDSVSWDVFSRPLQDSKAIHGFVVLSHDGAVMHSGGEAFSSIAAPQDQFRHLMSAFNMIPPSDRLVHKAAKRSISAEAVTKRAASTTATATCTVPVIKLGGRTFRAVAHTTHELVAVSGTATSGRQIGLLLQRLPFGALAIVFRHPRQQTPALRKEVRLFCAPFQQFKAQHEAAVGATAAAAAVAT